MQITNKDDTIFQIFEEIIQKHKERIEVLEYQVKTYKEIIRGLTERVKEVEEKENCNDLHSRL